MSTDANPTVRHFRFCGPVTGSAHEAYTLLGSEDTSLEITLDDDYCIIMKLGNDGDMALNNDFKLQYDIDGAASWADVSSTSNNVRVASTGDIDEATSTTERLGTSAETYVGSALDEVDGIVITNLAGGDEYEFYYAITFRSADLSGGESITFRLVYTSITDVPIGDGGTTATATVPEAGDQIFNVTLQDLDSMAVTDPSEPKQRFRDREQLDTAELIDIVNSFRHIDRATTDDFDVTDDLVVLRERIRIVLSVLEMTDVTVELRLSDRALLSQALVVDNAIATYFGSAVINNEVLSDALVTIDAIEVLRERYRTTTISLAVTDAIADQQAIRPRELADNLAIAEFLGQLRKHEIEMINNIVHLSDNVIATYTEYDPGAGAINNVTKTDTLEVTDALAALRERIRAALDTTAATDSLTPERERARQLLDSLAVTDAKNNYAVSNRTLLDSLAVTDAAIQLRQRARNLLDAIVLLDSIDAQSTGVTSRTLTDTFAVTDLLIPLRELQRALSDNLAATDNTAIVRTRLRIASDNLAVTDFQISLTERLRTLTDNFAATDSSIELRERNRILVEAFDIVDNVIADYIPPGSVTYNRTLQDLDTTVTDSSIELRERIRAELDNVDATDDVTATYVPPGSVIYPVTLSDNLSVIDFSIELRERIRLYADALTVSDSIIVTALGITNRTLSDALLTSDLLAMRRDRDRLLTDTIEGIADSLSYHRVRMQEDADAISLTDASTYLLERRRTLTDALEASDQLLALRLRYRELFDSTDVIDSVIALYITEILNPIITAGLETLAVDHEILMLHIDHGIEEFKIDLDTKHEAGSS